MRIDEVNWITAHNYGEPKWHLFSPSLRWKGKFWASTLPRKMCPIENKLLIQICWSWYHFSQEKLLHTLISVISSTYCGKYPVPFFSGPPCIYLAIDAIWDSSKMPTSDRAQTPLRSSAPHHTALMRHPIPYRKEAESVACKKKKKTNIYYLIWGKIGFTIITMITVKSCALTFMTR